MSISGIMPAKQPIHLSMILSALIFSTPIHGAAAELSLFQAIAERLSYMEDVGAYKAQNKIPVEDVQRLSLIHISQ
ncbi:MAG: chorismate mutase, partial [Gammaproteobacteria bacterium]